MVLPLMIITVAPASGSGVAQVWSAQASTVPVMVMLPVYVLGSRFTAEAFTPNILPAPLSVPEVAVSASHALLVEACQVTGREHVPVSPKVTFCVVEVACPCASEKASVAGVGGDSTHGSRTVSVTARVWALPCTATPLASLAAIVTCVV